VPLLFLDLFLCNFPFTILFLDVGMYVDLDTGKEELIYGVCFVDCATSEFNVGQFVDDNERNQLETLLLRIKPSEILYEKAFPYNLQKSLHSHLTIHCAAGSM